VNDEMTELRERYVVYLHECEPKFWRFLALCEVGQPAAADLDKVNSLAHDLNGTGATFGFPELSATAAALEAVIERGEAQTVFVNSVRAILTATGNAIVSYIQRGDTSVQPGDASLPEVLSSPEAPVANAPSYPEGPRLLVLLNDKSLAATVGEVFASRADLITADNEAEALALDKAHAPDLVILDMKFAGGARAVLEAVCANPARKIPALVLASSRRDAAMAHAITGGRAQSLIVPAIPAAIYEKILSILRLNRLVALTADDDPVVRELLNIRFTARGFRTIVATNGDAVLALAKEHRPSIILLDRTMPGLEGLAVLSLLKDDPATSKIPVIMLSSHSDPEDFREGRRRGAADYLIKPFSPDDVVSRCLEILEAG
jgi:CheY-like chemotaxis protein